MLKYGNKEFRNLQEQVLANMRNIEDIIHGQPIMAKYTIKIVGSEESASDLPDPLTYEGDLGDIYVVGTESPYNLYVFGKEYENEDAPSWIDLGAIWVEGPQGEKGDTGLGVPEIQSGDAGKVLMVNSDETDAEWTSLPSDLTNIEDGSALQSIIQKVGNPESATPAPDANIASQWWAAAFGKSNESTNYASFTTGTRNENNGDSALVGGVDNEVSAYGFASFTIGRGNVNNSESSIVGGYYNTSASDVGENLVVGTLLQANNDNQHIIGTANELKTGLRFVIGNGTYGVDPQTYEPINIIRKNAFEVYKNGNVKIPEGGLYASNGILDSSGTKQLEATTNGAKATTLLVSTIKDTSNYDRFILGGTTTVNASLVPNESNIRDFGSSSAYWNNTYLRYVYTTSIKDSGGTERIGVSTGGTVTITGHISPDNSNTRNIGTSSKVYKEVFTMKLCDNASNEVSLADLKALITYAKAQGWIS